MEARSPRRIGPVGTLSRLGIGALMVGAALARPAGAGEWLLGGLVFPIAVLVWQRARVRRDSRPIRASGPLGHLLTLVAFLVLYLTPWYAPALAATSGAALIFFGGSMWVAALRGYRGCELLALSNWLLQRDDQVGCVLFSPIDRMEGARRSQGRSSPGG